VQSATSTSSPWARMHVSGGSAGDWSVSAARPVASAYTPSAWGTATPHSIVRSPPSHAASGGRIGTMEYRPCGSRRPSR
jgi:hypothetical protein